MSCRLRGSFIIKKDLKKGGTDEVTNINRFI